jgi:hypothetical protein
MAEDIEVSEQSAEQAIAPNAEIAEMMAISLNGGIPPEPIAEVVPEQQEVVLPTFEILKERFSYESPDDAVREIEELRALKSQAVAQPAFKYENDFSEKIAKAINAGNVKEVRQFLEQQEQLDYLTTSDVTKDTAAEIIKLGMRIKYADLTQSEVDYKYNKQFAIPKEPVQTMDEMDEEFSIRKEEWKEKVADIEMNKIIEAKLAKPDLLNAKAQIKLPEVTTNIDEDYIQYKKMLEEQPNLDAELMAAYKSFTTKSIETKINFNDEANKIAFDFKYEPDSETFNKSVEMALDINKFWANFQKSDGTPDRQKFLDAIYFATNKERILMEAMKQAKNATVKSFLPDNSQGNVPRYSPQTQEISELDKQMQQSLAGYMPRGRN